MFQYSRCDQQRENCHISILIYFRSIYSAHLRFQLVTHQLQLPLLEPPCWCWRGTNRCGCWRSTMLRMSERPHGASSGACPGRLLWRRSLEEKKARSTSSTTSTTPAPRDERGWSSAEGVHPFYLPMVKMTLRCIRRLSGVCEQAAMEQLATTELIAKTKAALMASRQGQQVDRLTTVSTSPSLPSHYRTTFSRSW